MSSQQTIPRPHEAPDAFLTAPASEPPPARLRPFHRFFLWLFLIPAIIYVTAIPLVLLPSYFSWAPSHWGPMLDYPWHTQGQNADVVVFGDSSAFLGIDPHRINAQLGIKSLALPDTIGSLPVTRDMPLEFYLAHNTRPRLIVLYFTPWDLNYDNSGETHLYEGEELILRHGTVQQIKDFALQHPLELPSFPLRTYGSFGPGVLKAMLSGANREQQAAQSLGHMDYSESAYPPIAAGCTLPAEDVTATDTAGVRALAAKYRARGYRVVLYLAPIPGCTNSSVFARQTYNGLALAPPAILPSTFFNQDGLYAHMEPAAVPEASRIFADAIAASLGK
jgi:hypothetical protein